MSIATDCEIVARLPLVPPPTLPVAQCCQWPGIGCDGARVTSLSLGNGLLRGSLDDSLSGLTGLKKLDLWNNALVAKVPDWSNWTQIETINIAINFFSGELPDTTKLAKLAELTAYTNRIRGNLPPQLGSNLALQSLNLGNNRISGTLPESLGNLPNLTIFHVDQNQLTGTIPATYAKLTRLTEFVVYYNNLTGPVPILPKAEGICDLSHGPDKEGNGFTCVAPQPLDNLCGDNLRPLALPTTCPTTPTTDVAKPMVIPSSPPPTLSMGALVGIGIGIGALVFVGLAAIITICRSRKLAWRLGQTFTRDPHGTMESTDSGTTKIGGGDSIRTKPQKSSPLAVPPRTPPPAVVDLPASGELVLPPADEHQLADLVLPSTPTATLRTIASSARSNPSLSSGSAMWPPRQETHHHDLA
ncbi:hypothetical protein BC828DRAFT_388069 [Blastocladiella britannica]|nr:hypothetical protein BC828DRAFT_388069 [Blastocladiella britannica]